jgi:pilus assembly protein Flp/PilA
MKNQILMATIKLNNLLSSEEGQDLIEYALVVALVAFGATAAMGTLASKISTTFTQIGTSLSTTVA